MSLLLAFQGAGPPAVTGTVAQAQKKQAQSATGAESFLGTVAQSQVVQAQASSGSSLLPITGTVAQAQAKQQQASTGAEAMLGTVGQAQARQQQAALGAAILNVTGQVDQAQALQGQQIVAASVVSVVSVGGALPILRRRGKPIYITLPGGRRKKVVRVEVRVIPKPPEPDRRAEVSLKNLKRLASIRVELPPVPKINPAEMRQAVRAAFAVSGSVAQTQAPAHQQVTAKESRPDEEMLLLLIA